MSDQDDEPRALRALYDLLRPGGVIVITGPTDRKLANWFGLSKYYYALRRRVPRMLRPRPPVRPTQPSAAGGEDVLHRISAHAYGYGRFRRLLEDAGFEVLAHKGHGFVNFEIIGRRIGHKGELFLHRFFTAVARVLPIGRWANDLIFVGRRP